MTRKQKLLQRLYPISMWLKKSKKSVLTNTKGTRAFVSLIHYREKLNTGETLWWKDYEGKKYILFVNTASDCGYTAQYKELQQLADTFKDELLVVAFPSNDFGEQEKGTDKEIAQFCTINYGVTFPIVQKSIVKNTVGQNETFCWLSVEEYNGWLNGSPTWNFCKYLINKEGELTHFFDTSVSPMSKQITSLIV